MFKEKNLILKMPAPSEVLGGLGTKLPDKTKAHFQQLEKGDTDKTGFEAIEGAREMVVFVPEENPEQILDHPVFGPILRPLADAGNLFAERRSPVDRSFGTGLKNDVTSLPIQGMGSVQVLHIVGGVSPDGDPEGDEFHVPRKMRSATSAIKSVVGDVTHKGGDSMALYVDGTIVRHSNAPHVLKALGRALGNVTYETDLYRTEPGEKSIEGRLSEVEATQLATAKENGWTPGEEGKTPEWEFADLHRAIEAGEYELPTPEETVRSTRNALTNVYLVSDVEGDVDADALISSFEQGDMSSRVQSLCKFLAEAPHSLLNCELFVRVLDKLNDAVRQMGNTTEIEIYGPNIEGITVTGSTQSFGRKLEVLEKVHEGSGDEVGPFMVRMKYRHPEANGKPVNILAGKSLMFDNGGNCPKGAHGESMQGDMMGGASVAAIFARTGEEQPIANFDFVWGIASNKADGDARNIEDVMRHGSGMTTEEKNPDAEGREVLGDVIWAAIRRLREEGEEIGEVIDIATLTGAAVLTGGHRTLAITQSKKRRRLLEDMGIANGDRVEPMALVVEDSKAIAHGATVRADIKNLDGRRIRGAQNAAAYIKDAAQLGTIPFVHFDIAPAMSADKFGTPKDVQGEFACEGYLDTVYEYLNHIATKQKEAQAA